MSVISHRMQNLTIDHHTLTLPLVWIDADDHRTIDVHAAVVTPDGGSELPYLLYLQGGPGFEAPNAFGAPSSPAWLETALQHYRVVLLDQRGTGRSTPVGDDLLSQGTDAVVEYLTHLRADSIVRDAEAFRDHLGVSRWSTLGQSFGGFATLAYLSQAPEALDTVYFTGGLSGIGRSPDEIYAATYAKTRPIVDQYYRRFPRHREAVARLVDLATAGELILPDGEVVSPSRVRSLGMLLGSDHGWQTLWSLLDQDPIAQAFRFDLAAALPFSARNPLYYVLHESCCADGFSTRWAADRVEPKDFRDDPTLLTGEHVRSEWAETVPGLRPWREVAHGLAQVEWPTLYDAEAIAGSEVRGAASVYLNDIYVPFEASMQTAALMPGLKTWVTSEFEHSGLRTGNVLERLIDLAQDRRVR